jgi:fibronectin type 3 domain-containing protein
VANSGKVRLTITSITLTGANAADFAQTNNCGVSLAPGANCLVQVTFKPSAPGTRTTVLNIKDNATGSPQTVSLSGTGSHDVVLSWTASPTSDVIGYDIYRGTTPGGESSTPLNSTPVSGTNFTDENVTAGAVYYYLATSVTSDGVTQSAASAETTATVLTP